MSPAHIILAACLLALTCQTAGAAQLFRYRIEPPTVNMFLSGELESSESKGGAAVSKTDTTTTREKLDIRTADGWIYHPALLTFSAGLQPEFEQRRTERDQGGGSEASGTFLGFNLDASVLPYKPYTLDLHGSQNRGKYKATLARDQTTESSVYQAKLRLKEYRLPTTITLESRDQTSESLYTTRDGTDLAKLESQHKSENSDTWLETEFQERSRGVSGNETKSEKMVLRARNRYRPGATSTVNSNFRHSNDRWSDRDSTQTNLDSGLVIRHREELSSDYQLGFENRSEQDYNSSSGDARAALTHRLYENLATTLSGNARKSESTSGETADYGAVVNLGYQRRIPWGQMNASVGHTEQINDRRQVLAVARISREPPSPVFGSLDLVELKQLDIDITTIRIFDSNNMLKEYPTEYPTAPPLPPGTDYFSVIEIGRNVQLQWKGTGPAPPIRVDYSHTTDPSAKTRSINDSFGVGVNLWSMLGLSYNWIGTQVDLLSGTFGPGGGTQDRSSQTLSAFLNLGWRAVKSTTRASMMETKIAAEEREGGRGAAGQKNSTLSQSFRIGNWSTTNFDVDDVTVSGDRSTSLRSPTRTHRARQLFIYQPTRHMSLSVGANYSELKYKETGDRAESGGYDAKMYWQVGTGALSASAYSRETRNRLSGTKSMGMEADYQWRYGLWEPIVRYSLSKERQLSQGTTQASGKRTRSVLYFELKREFR